MSMWMWGGLALLTVVLLVYMVRLRDERRRLRESLDYYQGLKDRLQLQLHQCQMEREQLRVKAQVRGLKKDAA